MTSTHQSPLAFSVKPGRFDHVFTEVEITGVHDLPKGTRVRLYHLGVDTGAFVYKDLCAFIRANVGRYVFSRAQIAGYETQGNTDLVGWDASKELTAVENQDRETLGQILLYSFLEYVLGAPKVLSRFELNRFQGALRSEADALHLLPADTAGGVSQFVLGASYIDNSPQQIIDGAFEKITKIKENRDSEVTIVEQTLLDKSFTSDQVEAIERLIIPEPGGRPMHDTSYGIFVGYTLGLKLSDNRDAAAYRQDLAVKLRTDLIQHSTYIARKIAACGLEHHNFHIYTVPLNDARVDPSTIMNTTLGRR